MRSCDLFSSFLVTALLISPHLSTGATTHLSTPHEPTSSSSSSVSSSIFLSLSTRHETPINHVLVPAARDPSLQQGLREASRERNSRQHSQSSVFPAPSDHTQVYEAQETGHLSARGTRDTRVTGDTRHTEASRVPGRANETRRSSQGDNKLPSDQADSRKRSTGLSANESSVNESSSEASHVSRQVMSSPVRDLPLILCRIETGVKLPFPLYALHTCGKCYFYLPDWAFKPRRKLPLIGWGAFNDTQANRIVYSNETHLLLETFASTSMYAKWQQCCSDAIDCCLNYLRHDTSHDKSHDTSDDASHQETGQGERSAPPSESPLESENHFSFSQNIDGGHSFTAVSHSNWFDPSGASPLPGTSERDEMPRKSTWAQGLITRPRAAGEGDASESPRIDRLIGDSAQCPRTWDGWTCWRKEVPHASTELNTCPEHIYWRINVPPCRGYVSKTCTSRGWYMNHDGNEWSNYTNCARDDIHMRRLRYSIITNLISVSFILPALVIFNCYRQLSNSPRIRLHKHLFASLFIYAVLSSLLKLNLLMKRSDDAYVSTSDGEASAKNTSTDVYCLTLSLSLRYFRSTTYLCMFNEAYYLYQLIKKVFDAPPVTPLIVSAYTVPFAITSTYVAVRSLLPANAAVSSASDLTSQLIVSSLANSSLTNSSLSNSSLSGNATGPARQVIVHSATRIVSEQDACWMLPARESWKEWIINGPNLAMLLINSLLILPIVREIYMKATSMPLPARLASRQSDKDTERRRSRSQATRASGQRRASCSNGRVASSPDCVSEEGSHSLLPSYKSDAQEARGVRGADTSRQGKTSAVVRSTMTTSTGGNSSLGHSVSKASLLVSLRAATLLLPLYGLHYLVIVYRPDIDTCWLSELYHYSSLTLDGLQGFLVSILFCFGNNEVRQLLKRTLGHKSDANIYLTEIVPVPRASPCCLVHRIFSLCLSVCLCNLSSPYDVQRRV